MSIPAADIWAALSSAPSDKTVRTARPADVSRAEKQHKGFSAVLRKLRDVERKDEARKTDDTPSSSKTNERSNVKEARQVESDVRSREKDEKGRIATGTETERASAGSQSAKKDDRPGVSQTNEQGQTRAEQAESSSPRIVNTNESDSSKGTSLEGGFTEVDMSITNAEAQGHTDTQGQVPLFLSALVASTANQQPVDQRPGAEGSHLQGSDDILQQQDESSQSTPVGRDASASSPVAPQNGTTPASVASRVDAVQTQPQPTLVRSMTQAEQDAPGTVASESPQSSTPREMSVSDKLVGQDTSARSSMPETSSLNVKTNSLELKDVQSMLEPILKDHVAEHPKGDAGRKVEGQFLDHPLLSPSQGQALGAQDRENSALKDLPLSQQGLKSGTEFTEDFQEMWAGTKAGKQDQGEGKLVHVAAPEQQMVNGSRVESMTAGGQGALSSGSGSVSQGGPSVAQAHPAQPAQVTAPSPFPVGTKSVVFDVFQPDLGHVNVRVAMTNDVVHAHLSTDRQEVGQSLISGQDRLQSSLQASGLDMGQFRVDIDRQGAGRSFQQGFSQEQQERGWHQQASWGEGKSTSQTYDVPRAPLQGLLNVMA